MRRYRLQNRPGDDGVSFSTFVHFYHAMQSTETPVDHFSTVLYRFEDNTQTVYRLGEEPCDSVVARDRSPIGIIDCVARPHTYIQVYDTGLAPLDTSNRKSPRNNVFKVVSVTALSEVWRYKMLSCTYVLSKTATAATKELASAATPIFGITAYSQTSHCVYDLFGRFVDGWEETLRPHFRHSKPDLPLST